MKFPRIFNKLPYLLPIVSFALNALFFATNLPEITGPDEQQIILHALAIGSGDVNPHWADYPHLWLYCIFVLEGIGVMLGLAAGFFESLNGVLGIIFADPTFFYSIARLFTALVGAAAVWVTFTLGRRISPVCGWVAALALAFFAPFVWQSHFAKPDMALTFMILVCLTACVRAESRSSSNWESLWWPSICAGLATSVKYNGVVVFGAVAVTLFLQSREKFAYRLVAAGLAGVLAFGLTSPFVLLDLPVLFGSAHKLFTFVINSERPHPHLFYLYVLVDKQGWAFLIASVVGFGLLLFSRWGRGNRKMVWILAGFAVPYLFIIQSADYKRDSYLLPVVPIICLGAGAFVARITELLKTASFGGPVVGATGSLALILALLVPAAKSTVAVERGFAHRGAAKSATQWVEGHVPPGSVVLVDVAAEVQLSPDRQTVEDKMKWWKSDGSGTARQLVRAYSAYLRTELPLRGYRLVPTRRHSLHTFTLGYDREKDYDLRLLEAVEYIVIPRALLDLPDGTQRARFYERVRQRYDVMHRVRDANGEEIIIMRRRSSNSSD